MRPSERLRREHSTPRENDFARHRCRTMGAATRREAQSNDDGAKKKRRPIDRGRT